MKVVDLVLQFLNFDLYTTTIAFVELMIDKNRQHCCVCSNVVLAVLVCMMGKGLVAVFMPFFLFLLNI